MAAATPLCGHSSPETHLQAPKSTSIKTLAESPGLTYIPPNYTYTTNPHESAASEPEDSIPIIDFSSLTSSDPDQRSQVIQDLGKACQEWGFFMVVNHGVPESLMKEMVDACNGFFDLREEEKREFEGKHVLDPIRCGTSFNSKADKVFFWRDSFTFPTNLQVSDTEQWEVQKCCTSSSCEQQSYTDFYCHGMWTITRHHCQPSSRVGRRRRRAPSPCIHSDDIQRLFRTSTKQPA